MSAHATVTGRQVEINGASLYVEEQGTGDPVLLVQPGLVASGVYAALTPLLTQHYHVVAFDSRGHGRSTNPAGTISYEQIADDAAALADALGIERPFVGGWSDGGQVALEFGHRHPGRARGLIVGGASLEVAGAAAKAQMRAMMAIDDRGQVDFDAFARGMGQMLLPMMQQFHRQDDDHWRRVLQASAGMWLAYDGLTPDEVAAIAEPALIIIGDRDELITIEGVTDLYRSLPVAELAIMPGTAHMEPMRDPAIFAALLLGFCQRH